MVVFFERNAVFVTADVRMFLQRKKFCGARQVQHGQVEVNVLPDNGLRRKRPSECCSHVAMRRQSVQAFLRFSRAPRRFFCPQRYTIATRKKFAANVEDVKAQAGAARSIGKGMLQCTFAQSGGTALTVRLSFMRVVGDRVGAMWGYPNTTQTETGDLHERNAQGRRAEHSQYENEKLCRLRCDVRNLTGSRTANNIGIFRSRFSVLKDAHCEQLMVHSTRSRIACLESGSSESAHSTSLKRPPKRLRMSTGSAQRNSGSEKLESARDGGAFRVGLYDAAAVGERV